MTGAVHPGEVINRLKYNRMISQEARRDRNVFHNMYLKVNEAASFRRWWRAITEAAEKEGLLELRLVVNGRSGRSHTFLWRPRVASQSKAEVVSVKLPINRQRFGLPMEIEAKICINGSLESAGRRMMLFGRLIDEYSMSKGAQNWQEVPDLKLNSAKEPVYTA